MDRAVAGLPLKSGDLGAALKQLLTISTNLAKRTDQLIAANEALTERVAALEAKPEPEAPRRGR